MQVSRPKLVTMLKNIVTGNYCRTQLRSIWHREDDEDGDDGDGDGDDDVAM